MSAVEVLLFGGLRAQARRDTLTLDLSAPITAAELLDQLAALHPVVDRHRAALRVAVNGEYVKADAPVRPGDEVALIPPVAGG